MTTQTILVTGGCGFIGSNFVRLLLDEHSDITVVNLDALTYAGNLASLADYADDPRHIFVKGDIRDAALLERLFAEHPIDGIINFAAESHVDRSIEGPGIFVETNVLGTLALLQAGRAAVVEGALVTAGDAALNIGEAGKSKLRLGANAAIRAGNAAMASADVTVAAATTVAASAVAKVEGGARVAFDGGVTFANSAALDVAANSRAVCKGAASTVQQGQASVTGAGEFVVGAMASLAIEAQATLDVSWLLIDYNCDCT